MDKNSYTSWHACPISGWYFEPSLWSYNAIPSRPHSFMASIIAKIFFLLFKTFSLLKEFTETSMDTLLPVRRKISWSSSNIHLICTSCSGSMCLLKAPIPSGQCLKGLNIKDFTAVFFLPAKRSTVNNKHHLQLMSNITKEKV